ncbi:tRNA-dihydrouridine synthase C [Sinobacterium caligoides]|uniref:tRNA-dihydrouridine(16) synthase n=1 Tax=Sinobacterium caligoides TaxID=933926 RepID=A0A3N2DNH2_9GAMM|nr:tRNA-dihydrouridine synthase family protein [Sinobacterium caligoides]ROS01354.1 tRNA-dihydrouridine synthase C [Sinobacterium caligoides]
MTHRIMLAPMEGVIDHSLREIFSAIGGIDRCVTEFARVTQHPLKRRQLLSICPELDQNGHTRCGTPVYLQLLGSNPALMAASAARAAELGVAGIDINFGCPAKTVCNHQGGSILLEQPSLVESIIGATRRALPDHIPLSVKIRLGFNDDDKLDDNIQAAINGGANELCIHARTRKQGYTAPAYWQKIEAQRWPINIIANGEIWCSDDYHRCRQQSGSNDIMLGRGIIARPDLAKIIKAELAGEDYTAMTWQQLLPIIIALQSDNIERYPRKHAGNRIKQWLMYLQRNYPEAAETFEAVKRLQDPTELLKQLQQQLENA